ncbi:MAG: hypothetical protein JSS66_05630 [Armatimonadetes bacterium]|nr:hypothetical protein [Armatimonadota bacterium]
MKVWLLKRLRGVGYDEFISFVVVARTEQAARKRAAKVAERDDQAGMWLSDKCTTCEVVDTTVGGVVAYSFRHG